MNCIKYFRNNIKVYFSFIIFLIISIVLDKSSIFFILFLSVTLHELSHVIVARLFKLRLCKFIFTPIGEIAVIKNMELLSNFKRNLIFIAGPFCNIVIAIIAYYLMGSTGFLFKANVSLAIFNLIPVYPLDGGSILHSFLTNKLGVLNGNKIVIKFSKVIINLLIILGFIQVLLYPLNISLICIALYLKFINKKERYRLILYFYNNFINIKSDKIRLNSIPIKFVVISKQEEIKKIVKILNWDCFYVFYLVENGIVINKITEYDLFKHCLNNNYDDTVFNILN